MNISTEELFSRFDEETNIMSNENSELVILFGSRVTDHYTSNSDLDILIIVPEGKGYYNRRGMLIDGVMIETIEMTYDAFKHYLAMDLAEKSTFYESIFNYGVVKKDNKNIVEMIKQKIRLLKADSGEDNVLRKIDIDQIDKLLYLYRNSSNERKEFCYYALIDFIRLVYSYVSNKSNIFASLTYDLYTDEEKRKRYIVSIPKRSFIDAFILAIKPKSMDESLSELFGFIKYDDYLTDGRKPNISKRAKRVFDDEREIPYNLLYLAKSVNKVQDKLIKKSYDSDYVYFSFLLNAYNKYLNSAYVKKEEFELIFDAALEAKGIDERINSTEEIFNCFNKTRNFDYSDYSL